MDKLNHLAPKFLYIVAQLLFFYALMQGLRDCAESHFINFSTVEGLALGLCLVCLSQNIKLKELERELSAIKNQVSTR